MMNKAYPFLSILMVLTLVACRTHPNSNRGYAGDGKVYSLRLDPPAGATYNYHITNDSKYELQIDDKKIDNEKRTEVTFDYHIGKDSSGSLLLGISYRKAHVYVRNGDQVTEADADNAGTSFDPVEKALGTLRSAHITAVVDRTGHVNKIDGFREAAAQMLAGVDTENPTQKAAAQKQLEGIIEQGLIRDNMEQLFRIFPDSAVHIGDKWKLFTANKNDLSFAVKNFYALTSIEDGVAIIESSGEIASDTTTTMLMGFQVNTDLKGEQKGTYTMDIRTGMMLNYRLSADFSGSIRMMDREVPIKMEMKALCDGRQTGRDQASLSGNVK